jgi:hypothetical protein
VACRNDPVLPPNSEFEREEGWGQSVNFRCGSRQGHFFGFAFFTADFLAPFFALLPRSRTLAEFPLPGRLLKYWSGSRVEADGRRARSERGTSPAGCNERATTPSACLPRARRVASILALAGVARWAEIAADIGYARPARTARALNSAKNRQQRGPLQNFNSLLERPRRLVFGHVLLRGDARRETQALSRIAAQLGFQDREQYEAAVLKLLIDDADTPGFVRSLFSDLSAQIAA